MKCAWHVVGLVRFDFFGETVFACSWLFWTDLWRFGGLELITDKCPEYCVFGARLSVPFILPEFFFRISAVRRSSKTRKIPLKIITACCVCVIVPRDGCAEGPQPRCNLPRSRLLTVLHMCAALNLYRGGVRISGKSWLASSRWCDSAQNWAHIPQVINLAVGAALPQQPKNGKGFICTRDVRALACLEELQQLYSVFCTLGNWESKKCGGFGKCSKMWRKQKAMILGLKMLPVGGDKS